jgi:hypothetical protein
LKANGPEDKAFSAIEDEKNPATKLQLLLEFEKNFSNSEALRTVYSMLMNIYKDRNDTAKVNEFGEKTIKIDPENVDALMAVSRNYAITKTNLDRAVQYAQRAVDAGAKKRGTVPPPNYTGAQWKQYLDSLDRTPAPRGGPHSHRSPCGSRTAIRRQREETESFLSMGSTAPSPT